MRVVQTVVFGLAACLLGTPAFADPAEIGRVAVSYMQDSAIDPAWRARVDGARARYEAFAAKATRRYLSALAPPAEKVVKRGFVTPIMLDPTLRVGDIYASEHGFLIFRGRLGFVHLQSDFMQMPDLQAKGLSLAIGR